MSTKLICAVMAFTVCSSLFAKRFVVRGHDLEAIKNEINHERGNLQHQLKRHQAVIANFDDATAGRLRAKFGANIKIEEDILVHINAKPQNPGGGKKGGGDTPSAQPPQETPWGISHIGAPSAFSITRGYGAIVCIVDTGIEENHPDLVDNVIGGENFVVKKGRIDPLGFNDDNGHGTHVAGTIAALDNEIGVIGVAPNASIFAVKALDKRGSGYTSAIADGVTSCVANGAHVINLSLGSSSGSSILHDAIIDAVNAGVHVIAAAGNDGSNAVSYPAAFAETIAVSAIDSSNNLAYFSNYGSQINYAAPGVGIKSTVPGGSYDVFNGTSMATPHVVGVVALMVSSGESQLGSTDIGLTPDKQGNGLISADLTVNPLP
ncbi:MAG: S8 family peptidase [Bacteriovoracaceae bacterium]|jgi:subtilisin|nr:S8 family peptidase [Bacteriovoracaceae bacterium]